MTQVKCPKCGADQVSAGNKGFSLGKSAIGGLLLGPVGLLGGLIGSKKIIISCMACGHQWDPSKAANTPVSIEPLPPQYEQPQQKVTLSNKKDPKYDEAVELVRVTQVAAISHLYRNLNIGYNRSARIIDMMEAEGLIGPQPESGSHREVFIK